MPDIDVKTILLDGQVLGRTGADLASIPLPAAPAASAVSFTPTGTIAATDVQAAIAEVATEAAARPFIGTRLTNSSNQSIPKVTWTTVVWDVETFDVGNWHSNTVNFTRVTPGVVGYYRVSAIVGWAGNATGDRYMGFAVNGTRVANLPHTQAGAAIFTDHKSDIIRVAATSDYLELMVYQDTAASLDVRNSETSFAVQFLGT
jgi:hypothetical protein